MKWNDWSANTYTELLLLLLLSVLGLAVVAVVVVDVSLSVGRVAGGAVPSWGSDMEEDGEAEDDSAGATALGWCCR